MLRWSRPVRRALLASLALALVAAPLWAALTPADVGDIAPQGAPDGKVDVADVNLVMRAVAGDVTLSESELERADAAPVTPLSPATPTPQLVRPNPNPAGPVDVGDAVVVARRAAGLIAFDRLNQPPTVVLEGNGDIVSVPQYHVHGRMSDDAAVESASVDVSRDGTLLTTAAVIPDPDSNLRGTFSADILLGTGVNVVGARARDNERRQGVPASIRVILDQDPPLLAITSPEAGFATRASTVEISGTASDPSGVTVTVGPVDGLLLPPNLWGATAELPLEDENVLEIVARDGAVPPNQTVLTHVVVRDTTPPTITPDAPPEGASTKTLALAGDVADKWGIASVTVGGQDASITWDSATRRGRWVALVPVSAGANEYEVVAVDKAGNRTVAPSIHVTGDFDPPVVTLASPRYVRSSPTTLALDFSEPVYVDAIGTSSFSPALRINDGHITLSGFALVAGDNVIPVRVRDIAGNETSTSVTVTLDQRPPTISITRISNAAFKWVPENSLVNVITNAPSATVEGVVSDDIGVAGVEVNGYVATVDGAGKFVIAGVPLVPRANDIVATGTDLAGNTATATVQLRRDVEGPVVKLDFARAAFVSAIDPPQAAFTTTPVPARYYKSATDITVTGTASDAYYTGRTEALTVKLDGTSLPVTGSAPFSSFSFKLPVSVLRTRGLHLLEVESTDSLGNTTQDVQAMLDGQWVPLGTTIANALGLAAGPDALASVEPVLEAQVAGMNGDIPDATSNLGGGISITVYGIAFCQPPGNPSIPPYNCTPNVNVDLSLTPDGHIAIRIDIPTLYAGIRTTFSGLGWKLIGCEYSRDGYMTGVPTTVTLQADFVNTPTGVKLQERAGTVSVTIGKLTLQTNHGCAQSLLSLLSAILGGLESTVAGLFTNQIPTLLSSVNDTLAKPLLTDANTGRGVWIARASNDASSIRFWLDAHGNPCPSPSAKTNILDASTADPTDYKPCPVDSPRMSPGSYAATPNTSATTLPNLDLVAPDGTPVSTEMAANDDFVNYMVHEQWAMGAFDMTIDQSFLGADAPITLDTDALSLFMPDLKRSDVVNKVPRGSKIAIQTAMPLPPVLSGRQATGPLYDFAVGDMTWKFMADADGIASNGYETPLFTAAVTIRAPAQLSVVPAPKDNADDKLKVQLGTPTLSTDITDNPLVLNEASVRSAIATLVNVALPSLTGGLGDVTLPSNTARFEDARMEAPAQDFLVLSGDLLQTITVTAPAAGTTVTTDPVVIQGTVAGLQNSAGTSVALWLESDTSGRAATITGRADANTLAFRVSVPLSAFNTGANKLRLVATDANGKKASLAFTMTRASGGVTAGATSGCGGCDGTGGGSLGTLLLAAFLLLLRARRRPAGSGAVLYGYGAPALLAAALAGGMADCDSCSGCGANTVEEQFHGPAVSKDPAFLIRELQIGTEEQGFNVDENSPGGDPFPDNALQVLGPLANENLADAVKKGQVLLLVQFPGLSHLPAPGESGTVEAVAYLGVDTDKDPSDNFSGSEVFARDPASFDDSGKPLIVFHDVELTADAAGTVKMKGGPSTFKLAIPLQGTKLELQLSPTFVEATLGISPLRADGIEARDGLLGGVLPAGPLATPIQGLPFAPLSILASEIDVDLNGDGTLDHSATAENKDGLSAGLVFSAVPAFITDTPVNRPPLVSLTALPELSTTPKVTVTGTVKDPDGDCTKNTVSVTVNGLEPVSVTPQKADAGCTISAEVRLVVGRNAIKATATDPAGDSGSAEIVTRFEDHVAPTLVLTAPTGRVTDAEQLVTGTATDDAGISAVQLDVAGTLVVVAADELDAQGHFSKSVKLPVFGPNVITGVAKDVGDNLSAPATLDVTLADVDAPSVTFTAASTAHERLEADGPWTLSERDVTIDGSLADNAGLTGLTATWSVDGGAPESLAIDPETGAFQLSLSRGLGTYRIAIEAVDAWENHAKVERTLTIADRAGPAVVVESPEALTHAAEQELVVRLTDDWAAAEELEATAGLNGAAPTPVPFDAATGTFHRPMTLVVGSNALVIEARDPAGNVTRIEGDLELVDEEPPVLTVTAPDDASWTLQERVHVTGTARDNIGPVRLQVDVDGVLTNAAPAADGTFDLEIALKMGANTITIGAIDAAGLVTQVLRHVERKDPEAVATVDLTADPTSVAAGNDTVVTLTAALTRLAGGPVRDGTTVQFLASPATLGTFQAGSATTSGGQAKVGFVSGRTPGVVTFTATSQGVSDTTSVTIAKPTAVAIDVCLAKDAKLAGASFEIAAANGATFEAGAPGTDATKGVGPAQQFHTYNRAAVPTKVVVAGTAEFTGTTGGTKFARLTWPLKSGLVGKSDVVLGSAKKADEVGTTTDASSALSICTIEHLLGQLPPRVTLAPMPATTANPQQVVSGTVESADLAGCQGVLSINGQETPLDVASGTFSQPVTLAPGANDVRVIVTDSGGQQGVDARQVTYVRPNTPPALAITAPGAAVTSTSNVVVEGTVSDSDDGLAGLSVTVKIGTSAPVTATVDATAGTWRATVNLQAGNNAIAVTATDARGGSTVVTQSTQVVAPIAPPRITLTAPTDGQVSATQTVTLAGRVDDGGNPATIKVTLTVNGASQPITFSPFTRDLSATISLQAGTNVLVVTATDITSQSAVATRRVDYVSADSPPRVAITSPTAGSRYTTRTVTVRGTVRDDKPLGSLKSLLVNGVAATVDASAGTWTATVTLTPGSRTITAEAIDERNQSGTASVTIQVFDPVVVVNYLQIGGPSDGFNVDSTPLHPLSDAAPDNALSGLASVANGPLQQQIDGTSGKPLILLFEIVGMTQLPSPGQSVTVTMNGYIGIDTDNDVTDNFSGAESFEIDPASFDPVTNKPKIQFTNVVISNSFGVLKFDTFPNNPAHFALTVDSTTPPLTLRTDPAYVRATIGVQGDGLRFNPALLGGVVPASTLTVPISAGDLSIVPLQLLISSDPANPVPDVDLNGDGVVNTVDATATNPDGVSVGIVFTAVPASITR